MKLSKTILVALILIIQAMAFQATDLESLLALKKHSYKTDIFGRQVRTQLQDRGQGITEGQEQLVLKIMQQASTLFSQDLSGNAKFIAAKVQDSLGGKWNVQIFGGDPSWGRSTHISQNKWLMYFSWGSYQLDYIIWSPDC